VFRLLLIAIGASAAVGCVSGQQPASRSEPVQQPQYSVNRTSLAGIPPEYFPPPEACRIWIDRLPPQNQPPVTDCATAERDAPANARVVYGVTARPPGLITSESGGEASGGGWGRDRMSPSGGQDRRQPDCRSSPNDRVGDCKFGADRYGPNAAMSAGCVDANYDGWCDAYRFPARFPPRGPSMQTALLAQQGQLTAEARQWLGPGPVGCRVGRARTAGAGLSAVWFDRRGAPVQLWLDADGDGRTDEIRVYRNNRMLKVVDFPERSRG
jgi:hypothetical protein